MNIMHRRDADSHASQELSALGLEEVAYVRASVQDGQALWSIHSADGQEIGQAPTRALAFAAIVQHDMEPASVH
jgi:hypothetical protein